MNIWLIGLIPVLFLLLTLVGIFSNKLDLDDSEEVGGLGIVIVIITVLWPVSLALAIIALPGYGFFLLGMKIQKKVLTKKEKSV